MNKTLSVPLFYTGTFLSSVGGLTFSVCLIAFMLQAGFPLLQVSLILGLQRFIPVLVTGIWGHITDRLNPRLTVVVLEILAALCSFILFHLWRGANTHYIPLLAICALRSIAMNFQTGSRCKIAKMLADGSYGSNAKHAIWQMKSTQGATLFAGLIGVFLIKYLTMKVAIVIDLLTFALNGIVLLNITFEDEAAPDEGKQLGWKQQFYDLYKYNPQAAILDALLALSIAGLMSFMARVADGNQVWNAVFMTSYGLSVWIAGFLERSFAKKFSSIPFWIVLAGTYVVIGNSHGPGAWVLSFMFLKDISYWIILHRISGHIQADTPKALMGGVSSARFSIMVVILSIGEVIVGAWAPSVSLWTESSLRACVALSVGLYLLNRGVFKVKAVAHDRPAL
jgi:hypothetical protein